MVAPLQERAAAQRPPVPALCGYLGFYYTHEQWIGTVVPALRRYNVTPARGRILPVGGERGWCEQEERVRPSRVEWVMRS